MGDLQDWSSKGSWGVTLSIGVLKGSGAPLGLEFWGRGRP